MASTTINNDGTITVTLSAQEQGIAQLILSVQGPDALTNVFNLWFTNKSSEVFNAKFAQLSPQDRAAVLAKFQ